MLFSMIMPEHLKFAFVVAPVGSASEAGKPNAMSKADLYMRYL
jgi:hypothetical protein